MSPLLLFLFLSAGPVIVQNDTIRVEVDPQLFCIRFVGYVGDRNWVEPRFVPEAERDASVWADAGGLYTEIVPEGERDPALRRGPASIVSSDEHGVVLLGPESASSHLQVKKEIRVADIGGRAMYIVTVLSSSNESRKVSVRNSVCLPQGGTLSLSCGDGPLKPLSKSVNVFEIASKSMEHWLIPVPCSGQVAGVTLGSVATQVTFQTAQGTWSRSLSDATAPKERFPEESSFRCFLDDASRSYVSSLQGLLREVNAGSPVVLTEEWNFSRRGN